MRKKRMSPSLRGESEDERRTDEEATQAKGRDDARDDSRENHRVDGLVAHSSPLSTNFLVWEERREEQRRGKRRRGRKQSDLGVVDCDLSFSHSPFHPGFNRSSEPGRSAVRLLPAPS